MYASVLLDSKRQVDTTGFSDHVTWRREIDLACALKTLPAGFRRCLDILPVGLLDCIADVAEMKSVLPTMNQLPYHMRYNQLDCMQASLEDRLVRQTTVCREFGAVTEACRLGVFLCCYCAWIEVWNDRLILSKLAEKLLSVLDTTLAAEDSAAVWKARADLFCWLLFTTCSVADLGQDRIQNLKPRLGQLLLAAKRVLRPLGMQAVQRSLHQGLHDFFVCDGWVEGRHRIKHWYELERSLTAWT